MVDHVEYPKIDAGLPASSSSRITSGLLLDDLGFEGLSVTDSIGMGVLHQWPIGQRPVLAVGAGTDMVLLTERGPPGSAMMRPDARPAEPRPIQPLP